MRWDPKRPETILEESFLDRVVPVAKENGIRVVFHVFPISPTSLTSSPDRTENFAAFLTKLATAYPDVRDYVIGNEPNQPRFQRPQFSPRRAGSRGARLRGAARALLRRAEGGRSGDPGDRPGPLRPRQRPAAGAVERLHVAGPLPARPRRGVPRERADAAADGRARPPPLPALGQRPGQRRRPLAAGGDRQSRQDQAGVLGRLRRHRSAHRRAGPEDPHRRDRLAGRRSRRTPRRLPRP